MSRAPRRTRRRGAQTATLPAPAASAAALAAAFRRHVAQTSAAPLGLVVARARGSWVIDRRGRRYLDLLAGMGVANVGHSHPAVVRACAAQLRRYLHVMVYGEYVLEPQVRLAARLAALAGPPFAVAYFTNSGAEAIEGALKAARKYTGRARLVAFDLGFHGDTLGALSIGGNARYRAPFTPLLPGVTLLPWNDARALGTIDRRVAAVVIEPVQAEGGVRVADPAFLRALRARCTAVGAVLIFDEVVTGLGRTGTLFAFEHGGVRPDLLVLAKALGGGLPLGAVLAPRALHEKWRTGTHGSTFGGNPVSCASGLATIQVIRDEGLLERADVLGAMVVEELAPLRRDERVREIRAIGAMAAIEFDSKETSKAAVAAALERDVLLITCGAHDQVVRFIPALNIDEDDLRGGVRAFVNAVRSGAVTAPA